MRDEDRVIGMLLFGSVETRGLARRVQVLSPYTYVHCVARGRLQSYPLEEDESQCAMIGHGDHAMGV